MSEESPTIHRWMQFKEALDRKRRLLVWPTACCGALSLLVALFMPRPWNATQAVLVRDEAGSRLGKQGRFESVDALKAAQETVVQLAKNQEVIARALRQAGTPNGQEDENWPSLSTIEKFQGAVSVTPPKGTEMGASELLYLSVTAESRDRALVLADAVCSALETGLQDIRADKARSMIAELEKTVQLSRQELESVTAKLETIEKEVGRDLGELRTLNELGTGDSNLRTGLNRIKDEERVVRSMLDATRQQLQLLNDAKGDPERLLSYPKALFETQPGLRKLREGLAEAQLRTAQLLGKMREDHPEVATSRAAEEDVRSQLAEELPAIILSLQTDIRVGEAQLTSLQEQRGETESRLEDLAGVRARYGNLTSEVRQRSDALQNVQKDLVEARGILAATSTSSLLTRIDEPVAGNSPLGPGRLKVLFLGTLGGLAIGGGLVFLSSMPHNFGFDRRGTDRGGTGRRWSDLVTLAVNMGRRRTDQLAGAATTAGGAATAAGNTADRRRGSDRRQE